MNRYEAMFILKTELSEEEKKTLFTQLGEAITKHKGEIASAGLWGEKRKLFFPLKRHREGIYYLISFSVAPSAIKDIRTAYRLNEDILRVLITKLD